MKIIKVKNYQELFKKACEILVNEIYKQPNLVIGFATGETPLGLYKELVNAYKKRKIDFSKIKSFNLDEYYPIRKSDKNSFYQYMLKNLFNKVNIKKSNINFLNGETKKLGKECLDYELKIKRNPIDIQILGVGVNGHIGFDEPGSTIDSKTRLIKLTKSTIRRNSKFFKNKKMPAQALTMGINTILKSRKIILLASGKDKKLPIKHLIKGPTRGNYPVSYLRKHKNLILIADKACLG
ncbi:glucosamine-6-phosphate deaminase [Candidatus Pacearchaeota archaeon]|nr:glucosamine-6-phosphate deaminase [Candidatus Pacearchaeota archaeon]